jgi:hypothetical protein
LPSRAKTHTGRSGVGPTKKAWLACRTPPIVKRSPDFVVIVFLTVVVLPIAVVILTFTLAEILTAVRAHVVVLQPVVVVPLIMTAVRTETADQATDTAPRTRTRAALARYKHYRALLTSAS